MTERVIVDAFCGAGGAALGYARAGWIVVGVDINPQPNYPFEFVQADAIHFLAENWEMFDAGHGSPPCQPHSAMSNCRPGLAGEYADLIAATRGIFELTGLPYVIENVVGAPLQSPIVLCGQMFGLELYRHRLFESNILLTQPPHPKHTIPASKAGHWHEGTIMSVSGHVAPIAKAREVMGIDWMTRDELAESIPPAYTQFIGEQLLDQITRRGAA